MNKKLVLYLILLFSLFMMGCDSKNTDRNFNPYDIKAKSIRIKGNIEWIKKVKLKKFKKGTQFDTLIKVEKVSLLAPRFDSVNNLTIVLMPSIDYNFDFVIEFIGQNKIEVHKISELEIKEHKATPFDYYEIVKYRYNDNIYRDNAWKFILDNPIIKTK